MMEYTFGFLKKCNGLYYRTVKDMEYEGFVLYYENSSHLVLTDRQCLVKKILLSSDFRDGDVPVDGLEIVPRDPEKYMDWHVGDKITGRRDAEIVFRSGEVVMCKFRGIGGDIVCSDAFLCDELFRRGCRLVLTDIEKEILAEKSCIEDVCPFKEGDVVLVRSNTDDKWAVGVFIEFQRGLFCYRVQTCDTFVWRYCIPYNEETRHLLGTTDEYRGE